MITVTQLSRNYPSIWKKIFPFLSRLVKKCNLQKEIFEGEMILNSNPKRRALINETGFCFYKKMIEIRVNKAKFLSGEDISSICKNVFVYIKKLDCNSTELEQLNNEEILEASKIADNIYFYFNYYELDKTIELSPDFFGCGLIANCAGDIIVGETLYEIKAGERDFRISDIKQLLIYLTLNYSSHHRNISCLGLLNPRLNNFIVLPVKDAIEIASGQSTLDCFNELIDFFDSPDDFR